MKKKLIVAFILLLVMSFFLLYLRNYFSLDSIKEKQEHLTNFYQENPFSTLVLFSGTYIVITALSLPGAAVMSLAAGAFFGLLVGTILVLFSSTIGATLAFTLSRFLIGNSIQKKYASALERMNEGIHKEGTFYLFALRLVPLFPFFLINLLMGLTTLKIWTFFWVSQIGMLPGTIAYVYAGQQLSQIESLQSILSLNLILAFSILGILPLISKKIIDYFRYHRILRSCKKPKSFDYNLVIIGAGSAGLVSAYIASRIKAKVALIEKDKMGGDCLNTGCVPSKALICSAKLLAKAKRAKDFGFRQMNIEFDFRDLMKRVQKIIKTIEIHDSIDRYTELGVDCIHGKAKVVSPYCVEVNGRRLNTKAMIIATGAHPFVPPISGLEKINYFTSDTIWKLEELPKRLVVLGAGPIGCELAQCFVRCGAQTTIVEKLGQILIREDRELTDFLSKQLQNDGIDLRVNHTAKTVESNGQENILVCEHNGEDCRIPFDVLLLAIGRKANVNGFGLEEIGVELESTGTLRIDPFLRTNYPNIYACGDVIGPYQFTHTAAHQAWHASINSLLHPIKQFRIDYRVIPWVTFTDPEIARVGLNESDAKSKNIAYERNQYSLDDLDRAITDSEDFGFIQVLTPPGKDKILGASIVGTHAGELIAEFVLAMKYGIGLKKILATIHSYPTWAEANRYLAGNWRKAHIPQYLLHWMERFHRWRR